MNKKYIVRLTAEERDELATVIKKLKGTGEKVRRAQILLKADAEGPNWADRRIAEAFGCRIQTVEGIRQRLVEHGFREALDRRRRQAPRWRSATHRMAGMQYSRASLMVILPSTGRACTCL